MITLSRLICAGVILSTAVAASASDLVRYNGGRSGMHSYRVQTEQPTTVALYTDSNTVVRYVKVEQQIGARFVNHSRNTYTGPTGQTEMR